MRSGRVWKFGDNINTDLMLPGSVLYSSPEQQARAVFMNNRPGWVDQVQQGDAIVGGFNYGMGSSRPAARSLRNCGVGLPAGRDDQRPVLPQCGELRAAGMRMQRRVRRRSRKATRPNSTSMPGACAIHAPARRCRYRRCPRSFWR